MRTAIPTTHTKAVKLANGLSNVPTEEVKTAVSCDARWPTASRFPSAKIPKTLHDEGEYL